MSERNEAVQLSTAQHDTQLNQPSCEATITPSRWHTIVRVQHQNDSCAHTCMSASSFSLGTAAMRCASGALLLLPAVVLRADRPKASAVPPVGINKNEWKPAHVTAAGVVTHVVCPFRSQVWAHLALPAVPRCPCCLCTAEVAIIQIKAAALISLPTSYEDGLGARQRLFPAICVEQVRQRQRRWCFSGCCCVCRWCCNSTACRFWCCIRNSCCCSRLFGVTGLRLCTHQKAVQRQRWRGCGGVELSSYTFLLTCCFAASGSPCCCSMLQADRTLSWCAT